MSPTSVEFATRWRGLREEIIAGVEAWRPHHPKASLEEAEAAVDEGLAELRTRMLQDVALASRAADVRPAHGLDLPFCPLCG